MMQQPMRPATRSVPQPNVVAALTTLSRLAAHTSARRATSPGVARRWARLLLRQLLVLCAAQQGALFIASPGPRAGATDAERAGRESPAWSLLTSLACDEAEASAVFRPFALAPDELQSSADSVATVYWKRLLPCGSGQAYTLSRSILPSAVAFVLRWPDLDRNAQESACQQAIQFLPLLADLVDTILAHILPVCVETEPHAEILSAELLATIGHELRGPLTTIQGYAQTLARYESQLTPAERQEFLRAISQASAHIDLLVNRFLDLAQFEAHTHAFFPTPVNLWALAQESLTAAQEGHSHHLLLLPATSAGPQAAASLSADPSQDAFTLEGDRRLLRNMLDILLENALAYSAPESLVEVSLEPCTFAADIAQSFLASAHHPLALILPATFHDQEPLLEVCVQDHGRGIASEELSAIFQRFYRGDTSLTREVNGLGLGLTLCKAIVAQHQGMLWVESELGEGSTFHLLLPRRQTIASQDNEERAMRDG